MVPEMAAAIADVKAGSLVKDDAICWIKNFGSASASVCMKELVAASWIPSRIIAGEEDFSDGEVGAERTYADPWKESDDEDMLFAGDRDRWLCSPS